MSILTDFFIATTEEMNALHVEQSPRDLFPTLETNHADSSKLEILAKLIIGNPQEHMPNEKQSGFLVLVKGALGETFISVDEHNKENPMYFNLWIERLDPVFVERLATFPAEQVLPLTKQWAKQWAEFDGRPVGKNDSESLSELMQQLCQLAKRAHAERKHLYLRTCV